jgi:predicted phosphodiesterase
VRPICWLHVSDIHMRVSTAWSQDVVLRAMCENIARKRTEGVSFDFILATGDLAFSGKADEYKLVAEFFDALSAASGVPKAKIFCIPGNHDIERDRQKMCFRGARGSLQSQNHIDLLLSPGDDLETLLKRQEAYRSFQNSYFTGQQRMPTGDGLGYVSQFVKDDMQVAILGVDSAWLAEGGIEDHGKLLIGERQMINAIALAGECHPHIVIGMAHHPFHVLQDFDRRCVQARVEHSCLFFHCGHLHEPEAQATGFSSAGCLTLAAGASFETRQSRNAYSVVTLDLLPGKRRVRTVQYDPANGAFSFESSAEYPVEITASATCDVGELAQAMTAYCATLTPFVYYLSALLLDQKLEFPIASPKGHVFGSFDLLLDQPEDELQRKTIAFAAFKNVLRVLYSRGKLHDLLAQYGNVIKEYAATLEQRCITDADLRARLDDREKDAVAMSAADLQQPTFSHTLALLAELAEGGEWSELRAQAERHADSSDPAVAIQAKRMLALSLANSTAAVDKEAAAALYRSLLTEADTEPSDAGNLAKLLIEARSFDEAQRVILAGIEGCATKTAGYFSEIGLKIVEATSNREFRRQMEAAVEARSKRD